MQGHPDRDERTLAGLRREGVGDGDQRDGAAVAVQERRAVQEERRRERAEQEVLERGLLRQQPAATCHAREQVQRERHDLERDEHQQQVVGRREHQHAGEGEEEERPDLGLQVAQSGELLLVLRAGQRRGARGERVAERVDRALGEEEGAQQADDQQGALHDERRAVDGDGALGGDQPGATQVDDHDQRRDDGAEHEDQLRGAAAPAGHERLDEHGDDGRTEEDEDRRDRVVVDDGHREDRLGLRAQRR